MGSQNIPQTYSMKYKTRNMENCAPYASRLPAGLVVKV
jgi:hypothetical protein